ncbi:hypothetical protein GTP56_27615 [Duganella sp. FT134W]|uniref:Uncharacterized protein n=1 Tax=Duganella margarita TaxID=2692170 RepID=A0A7X4KKR1_9BURK|nr:hypothetical protein [Duganella margarita]MYM75938.1 hypothetical protein [Duganella margarita]
MSDILEPVPPVVSTEPPPPEKKPRRWGRYILYVLATLGVLAIVLVGAAFYKANQGPVLVKIDEAASIDESMTRNYGKYSAERKGWMYVDQNNQPFLVRVVQQARIEAVGASDELYFVTSGIPLSGEATAFYGVFQIRSDGKGSDGLVEISDPVRELYEVPLKPENVHFEALSETLWGWVIKVQSGLEPKHERVTVTNVVLAPHGESIAELARFRAAADADPGKDCAQANAEYAEWEKLVEQYSKRSPDATDEEVAAGAEAVQHQPVRCEHARWTYATAPVNGPFPGPLTVTAKGSQYGAPMEPKRWKVMFDNKAFVYNVPEELMHEDQYGEEE